MTIDEAIKILESSCNEEPDENGEELWSAQWLGIEGLKDKKYQRITDYPERQGLLPGETKE